MEKIFDKFRNRFVATFDKELEEIDATQYMDDEMRDLYQRIGMDAPKEGEGGSRRRSRARGKQRSRDDNEEDEEEEAEEDVEEVAGEGPRAEEEVEAEEDQDATQQDESEVNEVELPDAPDEDSPSRSVPLSLSLFLNIKRVFTVVRSATPPPARPTKTRPSRQSSRKSKAPTKASKT